MGYRNLAKTIQFISSHIIVYLLDPDPKSASLMRIRTKIQVDPFNADPDSDPIDWTALSIFQIHDSTKKRGKISFVHLSMGFGIRTRCGEKLDLHDEGITYTVWISFAEIYNENLYDLFQKVPEVGSHPIPAGG